MLEGEFLGPAGCVCADLKPKESSCRSWSSLAGQVGWLWGRYCAMCLSLCLWHIIPALSAEPLALGGGARFPSPRVSEEAPNYLTGADRGSRLQFLPLGPVCPGCQ